MFALFTVLFVRVDHQAVGVPQPFLSAAPVPAVPRAQRFQAIGARFACQGAMYFILDYSCVGGVSCQFDSPVPARCRCTRHSATLSMLAGLLDAVA